MFLKTNVKYLRYKYKHGRKQQNNDPSAEASWNAENIFFFLKAISQDKFIWITIQEGENNSGELRLRRKLGMKNFSVILPKIEW